MTKLKDLLAEPEYSAVKLSAETPDNQQVERDFGRLAYAFLKDRASSFVPHLVGFEVVEQEPDGSRAVGIFGFRVASSFYYVPVFFLNNQIKGMDMLYSKEEKHFVPLREPWINHILNRKTIELGQPASGDVKKDFTTPDYTFLSRPPLGGSLKLSEAGRGIYDAWNTMQKEAVNMLNNDREFGKALAGAVSVMAKQASPRVSGQTRLTEYLENEGGPRAVGLLLSAVGSDMAFMKAANSFYDYHDLMVTEFSAALAPKTAESKIKVVSESDDGGPSCCGCDEEEKRKIVRDGFTIVDSRNEEEKSEVYDIDYLTSVTNPHGSGVYDMILASGITTPVFVVNIPYGTDSQGMTLVVHPDTGRYFTAHNKIIYVRDGVKETTGNDQLYADDRAVDVDKMNVGDTYVLVDERGRASLPFRVAATVSEDNDTVRIKADWKDNITYTDRDVTPGCEPVYPNNRASYSLNCYDDSYLLPMDRRGELKKSGNNVVVPTQQWKAYKLEVPEDYEDKQAQREAFRPASYVDIVESMNKIAFHRVQVESRDQGVAFSISLDGLIDQEALGYKAASVALVARYGFPTHKAEEVLKEASYKLKAKRLVLLKTAQQVVMGQEPPQYTGYDAELGVPVQPAQVDFVPGQTIGSPPPQPSGAGSGINIGGEGSYQQSMGGDTGMMPPDVTQLAQQAAQSGQQQVFDHAVIGGLSRVYDTSATIDGFIPELMTALDRTGRILFLFYWKNEDFAERYGDQDLTEMEDHIRAVFKSLGDLVLKLKQKTIDAEEAEYVQGA